MIMSNAHLTNQEQLCTSKLVPERWGIKPLSPLLSVSPLLFPSATSLNEQQQSPNLHESDKSIMPEKTSTSIHPSVPSPESRARDLTGTEPAQGRRGKDEALMYTLVLAITDSGPRSKTPVRNLDRAFGSPHQRSSTKY